MAWRNSRFSHSSLLIFSALSVAARRPLSTSALFTYSFDVCGVGPIFAAIDIPPPNATHADLRCREPATRLVANLREKNLCVALLRRLHPTQEVEPPANPARFDMGHVTHSVTFGACLQMMPSGIPTMLSSSR